MHQNIAFSTDIKPMTVRAPRSGLYKTELLLYFYYLVFLRTTKYVVSTFICPKGQSPPKMWSIVQKIFFKDTKVPGRRSMGQTFLCWLILSVVIFLCIWMAMSLSHWSVCCRAHRVSSFSDIWALIKTKTILNMHVLPIFFSFSTWLQSEQRWPAVAFVHRNYTISSKNSTCWTWRHAGKPRQARCHSEGWDEG